MPQVGSPEGALLRRERHAARPARRTADGGLSLPPCRHAVGRRDGAHLRGLRRVGTRRPAVVVQPPARVGVVLQAASPRIPPASPLPSRLRRGCADAHAVHLPDVRLPHRAAPSDGRQSGRGHRRTGAQPSRRHRLLASRQRLPDADARLPQALAPARPRTAHPDRRGRCGKHGVHRLLRRGVTARGAHPKVCPPEKRFTENG